MQYYNCLEDSFTVSTATIEHPSRHCRSENISLPVKNFTSQPLSRFLAISRESDGARQ